MLLSADAWNVNCKDDTDWVNCCTAMEVEGIKQWKSL